MSSTKPKTSIVGRYSLGDLEHKMKLLWWQEKGLSYTSTGYGRRIPTTWMVKLPDSRRWRRVYCCIFSNIGTCYVESGPNRDWIVITD